MQTLKPGRLSGLVLAGGGIAVACLIATLWQSGGFGDLVAWAMAAQMRFQNQMAAALRQLKQGAPGAWMALMLLCYGYGFLHAAGPGHGKFLISGYGIGARIRLVPLLGISLAASLAQATVAVALAYGGLLALSLTRDQVLGAGAPQYGWISAVAMALIGAWLIWRGAAGLLRLPGGHSTTGHHTQDHPEGVPCDHCGHSHGPSVAQIEQVTSWRAAVLLIGTVALRPCSGALMLLVLTWQLGVGWSGVAGAYVMALGTATVGLGVATLAVLARQGALTGAARLGWLRLAVPLVELAAGVAVALFALGMAGLS